MRPLARTVLLLLVAAPLGACDVPFGIRFREIPITRIDVPAQTTRGKPVAVSASCWYTAAGTLKVVAEIDQEARTVQLTALESEFMTLFPRVYSQLVATYSAKAEVIPLVSGPFAVVARRSTVSAIFQVLE